MKIFFVLMLTAMSMVPTPKHHWHTTIDGIFSASLQENVELCLVEILDAYHDDIHQVRIEILSNDHIAIWVDNNVDNTVADKLRSELEQFDWYYLSEMMEVRINITRQDAIL